MWALYRAELERGCQRQQHRTTSEHEMCKHSQSPAYVPPNKAGTKPETQQKGVWDIRAWELCVCVCPSSEPQLSASCVQMLVGLWECGAAFPILGDGKLVGRAHLSRC